MENKWIKASNTKPESFQMVYLYSELTGVTTGHYNGSFFEADCEHSNPDDYDVTHWMPKYLPSKPKAI